jgi:energy-coupling factor transporter transmembrane protein EcfT
LKDKKYIFGLTIITLTFLVSLNPYFLIFTVPVFLIGVGLLWFSKAKILQKTLWTVLPVILWYPSFYVFMYLTGTIGTATAQKLDFNFPNNFKGKAIVVQQMDCGQEIIKKDGREQLNFPENGILLYKGKIKSGYINHQYFYVTNTGDRKKIPERANYMFWDDAKTVTSSSEVGVWLEGMGMSTQFPPDGLAEYEYFQTIVSSKDSLEKYYDFHYNKRVDSLKYEIMKRCR